MAACINTYTFPVPTCFIDNSTETRLYEFSLVDCSDGETHTCEEYFDICPADQPYLNPVCTTINQYLFFQLQFHDNRNSWPHWNGTTFIPGTPLYQWRLSPIQIAPWFIKVELYDICCNLIEEEEQPWITLSNVMQKDGKSRQTIKIDTTNLPEFFMFKFTTWDGRATFSPPYQQTCCEKMVKYLGVYNIGFNCNSEFIGLPFIHTTTDPFGPTTSGWLGDPLTFQKEITFIGESYAHQHNIEKTNNRTRALKGVYQESWYNWLSDCPEYAAKDLAIVLTCKTIKVYNPSFSGDFVFNGALDKNNDQSNMWSMTFDLTHWVCDITTNCS